MDLEDCFFTRYRTFPFSCYMRTTHAVPPSSLTVSSTRRTLKRLNQRQHKYSHSEIKKRGRGNDIRKQISKKHCSTLFYALIAYRTLGKAASFLHCLCVFFFCSDLVKARRIARVFLARKSLGTYLLPAAALRNPSFCI